MEMKSPIAFTNERRVDVTVAKTTAHWPPVEDETFVLS